MASELIMTGADIKAIRKAMGMTQEGFARVLNVSFCTVNRWERSHNFPQTDRMERLMSLQKTRVAGKPVTRKKFDVRDVARVIWHASDGSVDVVFKDSLAPFTKEEFKEGSTTRRFIEELEKCVRNKVSEYDE